MHNKASHNGVKKLKIKCALTTFPLQVRPWQREELLTFSLNSLSSMNHTRKQSAAKTFRPVVMFHPTSAHTFTRTCTQTMICKRSRFLPVWHPTRSLLVTYSVSNSTQAKNRSHAEAQHTMHQPVHIRASNISRDHVILKGGSGFHL